MSGFMSTSRNLFVILMLLVFSALFVACCASGAAAAPREEKGIVMDTHEGYELKGDLYIPDGKGPFPGIIYFHGGGFMAGGRDEGGDVSLVEYFVGRGYAVLSSDYRLLPQGGIFPNSTKDANCALAWLKKNGAKYGVDATRIATMGESAGAYLASMVAFAPGVDYFAPDCGSAKGLDMTVKAAVLFYGPYNFMSIKGGVAGVLEVEIRQRSKIKGLAKTKEYKVKNSPINYVATAPPSLLINSARDTIVDPRQTPELEAALIKAGKIVERLTLSTPDIDHGFMLSTGTKPTQNALALAADFLDKYVKQ